MMMHKGMLWLAVVAVAGTLTLAAPARAQDTEMQGFTVSVGAFFPSKRAVRDKTQDVWFSGDISYTFQTGEPTQSGYHYELGVFAGFYGSGDFRNIPVGLSYTGHLNPQFFYRATAGVGFARFEESNNRMEDKTGFAWSIGFGYNFNAGTTPIALFVGYNGQTNTRDQLNGFTAMLQFRF